MDDAPKTPEEAVIISFEFLLKSLADLKPNDRSKADRYWAITITEVEKAAAIFKTYCTADQQARIAELESALARWNDQHSARKNPGSKP